MTGNAPPEPEQPETTRSSANPADTGVRSRTTRRVATALALLIVIPLALGTLLRIVDVASGPTDTLISFTPYAAPAALAAGILACAGRSLVVGAVCGVLFLTHLCWVAPLYVADRSNVGGTPMTVMSTNLKYGNGDAERVVELVREHNVSVLAIQELTPTALDRLRSAGLDHVLPHHHVRPKPSPAGSGIWSRTPLASHTFGANAGTTFVNLSASVRTPDGGTVGVDAVHPAPPLPSTSRRWRHDIGVVTSAARSGLARERPLVMVGDFNATRDHAPMHKLGDVGLADAADQAGAGYGPTWGPLWPVPPLFEIDHVRVSKDSVHARKLTRHAIEGTDHRAIIADLVISKTAARNG